MFVKPAENPEHENALHVSAKFACLQVFDPTLKNFLPAEGRDVGTADDLYWHRRINEGVVTVLTDEEGQKSVTDAEEARQAAIKAEADKLAAAEAAKLAEAAKAAKPSPKSGNEKTAGQPTKEGA